MQTLIREATLVLPDRLIDGGWLLIEDTLILALGDAASCPYGADRVISADGDLLLPGLIDLHSDTIVQRDAPASEEAWSNSAFDKRWISRRIYSTFHRHSGARSG